ncbi:10140_t:CDS:2, partial [Racocetra fulgida]
NEISKTATIVIRGATQNFLDDAERAIDDGVNIVKAVTRDGRLVAGAGATEMELLKQAFEVFPRTLAENAGLDATQVLSKLYAAHHQDDSGLIGVDIESDIENNTLDASKAGVFD